MKFLKELFCKICDRKLVSRNEYQRGICESCMRRGR